MCWNVRITKPSHVFFQITIIVCFFFVESPVVWIICKVMLRYNESQHDLKQWKVTKCMLQTGRFRWPVLATPSHPSLSCRLFPLVRVCSTFLSVFARLERLSTLFRLVRFDDFVLHVRFFRFPCQVNQFVVQPTFNVTIEQTFLDLKVVGTGVFHLSTLVYPNHPFPLSVIIQIFSAISFMYKIKISIPFLAVSSSPYSTVLAVYAEMNHRSFGLARKTVLQRNIFSNLKTK